MGLQMAELLYNLVVDVMFLNSGVDWSGSFTYVRMSAITVEITFGGGILLDLLVGAGVSGCCRLWTGNGGGWVRY